jgi:glyoxylase-like metal-dependent hydrolase (beta-lactamase superfamily II)
MRSLFSAVLGLALVAATVAPSAQDAAAVVAAASKAMGVEVLKTVQFSATGFDFALGQAPNPSSPWPRFPNKSYTRAIDFVTPASRVDRVRVQGENPPRGGGQQPIVGEQKQSQTIVVRADTPWAQQLEIWMLPHGFLRAAAARPVTLESRTVGGRRYRVVSFVGDNKARVSGFVNEQNLVERVETQIDNAFFGDMPFEAIYADFRSDSGVQFPMHLVQRQGGHPTFDLRVSELRVNVPVTIEPPAPATPAAPAAQAAQSEKLGDGVYLITGGYAAIAIDFRDHIAILETGQSEARGLAVIAEAKRLIPKKPVRYVVNTHAHVDHSSGLRAAVAEGATILTHEINKAYLENVLSQPHALNPDRAQQAGRKPIVEGVGTRRVLTDGTKVVELHHMQNFLHQEGMLMAYLPREKVLFQADAYNPPAANAPPPSPPSPYNVSLFENVQRLKFDVQRIVPVHLPADGRVVTMNELARWIGRSPATQ